MEQHFDIEKHLRQDMELDAPSPGFSAKVMGAVAGTPVARPSRTYINKKVVYGTGLFFLLLIAGAVMYALFFFKGPATEHLVSSVDFSKLDISRYFTPNILNSLLFLNVLLGLVFLDKYLVRRIRTL